MNVLLGAATVVMGVGVGVTSALFGVGGGLLMVPYMVLVLGLTQHVAEGTSLLVIVPTALVGAIVHGRRGYVDARSVAALAFGGSLGAVLGALVGLELNGDVLRKLFAILVAVAGVRLIRDGLKRGEMP